MRLSKIENWIVAFFQYINKANSVAMTTNTDVWQHTTYIGVGTDAYTEKEMSDDLHGNLKTRTRIGGGLTTGLTYDYTGNQLTGVTGSGVHHYLYDGNGNLINDSHNSRCFGHNFLNM